MSEFTPGPWVWAQDKFTQYTSLRQSGSGNSVIHPQADLSDYALSVDCWNDLTDADARLIAAAPELLLALQAIFDDYKQLADSGDAGNWKLENLAVGKLALAAIAKATGQ